MMRGKKISSFLGKIDLSTHLKFLNEVMDKRLPLIVLIWSFLFGVFMIVVLPPFQAPDEVTHYYQSMRLSQLQPLVELNGKTGQYFPKGITEIVDSYSYLPFNPQLKISRKKMIRDLQIRIDKGNRGPSLHHWASSLYANSD